MNSRTEGNGNEGLQTWKWGNKTKPSINKGEK
jgi:hypothetical protein